MTATDATTGTAESVVRAYYSALRNEEPLGSFFADGDVVKYGISEELVGSDAVRTGLREQTERTTDWSVESDALRVTERDCHAWFADRATLAWTDTERRIRYEFETRWSGTLERRDDGGQPVADEGGQSAADDGEGPPADDGDGPPVSDPTWQFVGMHVSTPGEL